MSLESRIAAFIAALGADIASLYDALSGKAPASHVGSGGTAHAVVTTTTNGFMAAADKTKLDGIAAGATANTGTVTSVAVANATGITWTGSPITGAGTLTPTLSANLQAWSGIDPATKANSSDTTHALTISSGVVNIDLSSGSVFTLALTANVTSVTFTNLPAAGVPYVAILQVKQDATGGRTMTWPASIKWPGGTDYAPSTTANAVDIVGLLTMDSGTSWQGVANKEFS